MVFCSMGKENLPIRILRTPVPVVLCASPPLQGSIAALASLVAEVALVVGAASCCG